MTLSDWRGTWQRHWFSADLGRTLREALPAQLVLLAWLALSARSLSIGDLVQYGGAAAVVAGPVCILYCAFRLRQPAASLGARIATNIGLGLIVALTPAAIITIMSQTHAEKMRQFLFTPPMLLAMFLGWLVAFSAAYVLSRIGACVLLRWNYMRRTRLVWSLTNAHLLVVVFGAGLVSLMFVTREIFRSTRPLTALPVVFAIFLLTIIVILIVLPPSALFSYAFAHRTTKRLEDLARATSALRDGNYQVRVRVAGDDELAQVQQNFNGMAEELEQAVTALKAERDTVERLLQAQRELVASVSHELRTPVATLRGYLESAQEHWESAPPHTLRHDLDVMKRETLRLEELIADLFTLSRAEIGQLGFHLAPTDITLCARHAVDAMAPLAWQTAHVEVALQSAGDIPVFVTLDSNRLEQALQNLLHNAARHTPPGGIVIVETAQEGDVATIRVRDTGEGIASEDLPHIWERFYRAEKSRARASGGAGIGLAIVKELTEAMHGAVTAESTPGEGACFTLRFPCLPVATEASGPEFTAWAETDGRSDDSAAAASIGAPPDWHIQRENPPRERDHTTR